MRKIFLAAGLLLFLTACSAPKETVTPAPSPVAVATATPTPPPAPTPTPEAQIPSYADPITGFFGSLTFRDNSSKAAIDWRSWAELEAWRAEVEHIYDVLRRDASPRIKELIDLDKLEQDFLDFAAAQGEAEAYCNCTNALGNKDGGYGEQIFYGTGFAAAGQRTETALLSAHAKAWYSDFTWLRDDRPILDEYVFDPSTRLESFDADEFPYTVGEYRLDPDMEEPVEEPENPIDDWLAEHLDDSGITYIMAENAWLELEIWENEMRHAYDLMIAKAHPTDPAPREALGRARDALLAYAPVYGECEALYQYSEGFHPETWEDDPERLLPGSIIAMVIPAVTGQCYRAVTFRLWDMLNWTGPYAEEPDYAFHPADYENRLLSPLTETAMP